MSFNPLELYLPPPRLLTLRVLIVLAVYAALIFAGRRGWLRPAETLWIGVAVIFWAFAWLARIVVEVVRGRYPDLAHAVPISLALLVPIVVAMALGLRFLLRRLANPLPLAPPRTKKPRPAP